MHGREGECGGSGSKDKTEITHTGDEGHLVRDEVWGPERRQKVGLQIMSKDPVSHILLTCFSKLF